VAKQRIEGLAVPKTTKGGQPKEDELPSTLKRSSGKAQRTFTKAYDAAAEQYGSEERAQRVAYSALKHSFEKVGDRWERKKKEGPSDARAERGGLHNPIPSAEGVDANASKSHLLDIARRLGVRGRSTMDKTELVDAIKKYNRRVRGR
jgi:cation transport regulator ChaB